MTITMLRSLHKCAPSRTIFRRNHFDAAHLAKNDANYAQLSPLTAFNRTTKLFPHKPAYVYNNKETTYGRMGHRVAAFASALHNQGVKKGDVVSVMSPNTPLLYEAHFAVPGLGAVLHSINTRLDATNVAHQLTHAEAKVVIVDEELSKVMSDAKTIMAKTNSNKLPTFIYAKDAACVPADNDPKISNIEYEDFLKSGDATFPLKPCVDEWDAISLNYTSGTTGNPKGVVCHHRGTYLNAVANVFEFNMERFGTLLSGKTHISLVNALAIILGNFLCLNVFHSCADVPLQRVDVYLDYACNHRVQHSHPPSAPRRHV